MFHTYLQVLLFLVTILSLAYGSGVLRQLSDKASAEIVASWLRHLLAH